MTTTAKPKPTAISDADAYGLQAEHIAFLLDGGYSSLAEWAEDSDLYYEPESGEWYPTDAQPGWPGPKPVNPVGNLEGAMEAVASDTEEQP